MPLLGKFDVVMVEVEVIYAQPRKNWCVNLKLSPDTTAAAAAELARNSEPMLWIDDYEVVAYAVWGKQVEASYVLQDGDRLELLRPLPVDPMEIRRRKAQEQQS